MLIWIYFIVICLYYLIVRHYFTHKLEYAEEERAKSPLARSVTSPVRAQSTTLAKKDASASAKVCREFFVFILHLLICS
jgi:hypothetical protein